MKTLKLYSKGTEVIYLQQLLRKKGYSIIDDGDFGKLTLDAVIDFQKSCGLVTDGIVGDKTWTKLLDDNEPKEILTELDYIECAQLLGVEVAIIKAVKEVESGNIGGFFKSGHPTILFEGHIFWNELKKRNKKPELFVKGNEDILYPKWTKKYYSSSEGEINRLNKAMKIDRIAALSSASWGMFQIMGFNYKSCNCHNIDEFVDKMKSSYKEQLKLFMLFILNNKLNIYLRRKDWAGFAKNYNGPEYAQNHYDKKLENAYNKYCK
jgi:hypothetical protein